MATSGCQQLKATIGRGCLLTAVGGRRRPKMVIAVVGCCWWSPVFAGGCWRKLTAREGVIVLEETAGGAFDSKGSSSTAAGADACSSSFSFKKEKKKINVMVIGEQFAGKTTLIHQLLFKLGEFNELHELETLFTVTEDESSGCLDYEFETSNYYVTLRDAAGCWGELCNMISGVCSADCTLLVVDSRTEFSDVNQHALIAHTLGVKKIVCCCSKMDKVHFSEDTFTMVKDHVLSKLHQIGYNIHRVHVIPVAALKGLNLTEKPFEFEWFDGPTVIESLTLVPPPVSTYKALRLPVNVKSNDGRTSHVFGRIETGMVREGMKILVSPGYWRSKVLGIMRGSEPVSEVCSGFNVELKIAGVKDVEGGLVISDFKLDPVKEVTCFVANIFVLLHHPEEGEGDANAVVTVGFEGLMLCHGFAVEIEVVDIISIVDRLTGSKLVKGPGFIKEGDAALVQLIAHKPLVIERACNYPPLGRFYVVSGNGLPVFVGSILELNFNGQKEKQGNNNNKDKKGKKKLIN
ncbi:elongation factor 1-alpha-like [Rutidosis leptorrhynchoides]|uniref:elongation factor 1-alpha-like n=1 Tax=Rutidosis leptorrhynchoides TaxID=125765 RepID=UPI003A99043B